MNTILFFTVCLTLSVVSRAEEGHAGHAGHEECEDMKQIKAKLCQPAIADDTILATMIECGNKTNIHDGKHEEMVSLIK